MKHGNSVYWKLFTSTFQLSAFTFGGGFVIVPLMKKKFVDKLKWINEQEILDITAIAQSSPGSIAVNAAILLGYRMAGIPGALVTILGTVLPPLTIISIISLFYTAFRDNIVVNAILKGMQAGIAAVIMDISLTMGGSILLAKRLLPVIMMIGAFIANYFFRISVVYIILICGVLGAGSMIYEHKDRGR
ncbi:MAG: chromate transport protein ChrA [Anaerocolumna sp.]|jgi:chromate transporter|nr:chromate transport protein ChrA [Anaerocolumna sp.]